MAGRFEGGRAGSSASFGRGGSFSRATSGANLKARIKAAFDAVDTDGNGVLDKKELTVAIRTQLGMQLEDPINEIDVIFAAVDDNNNGLIEIEEFIGMLEPQLKKNDEHNTVMEIEEVMRLVFTGYLNTAKAERARINKSFNMAHEDTSPTVGAPSPTKPAPEEEEAPAEDPGDAEKEEAMPAEMAEKKEEPGPKGFGVDFWGYSWRFKLYDDLYTNAKQDDGKDVHLTQRVVNLKKRLENISKGTDPWIAQAMESSERVKMEIANPKAVQRYCALWLKHLLAVEAEWEIARTPSSSVW